LLGKFFEPFLFEESPAIDLSAQQTYLSEVKNCDIYLVLLGQYYGFEDTQGISPTEREFDEATAQHNYRICFIKTLPNNSLYATKQQAFIRKVEQVVVRKSFENYENLQSSVYASLVRYLEEKELLRLLPFDASHHPYATLDDIDSEKLAMFIRKAKDRRNSKLNEGMSLEQLLTHLDLFDYNGQITNAAILLFGKAPQRFFISSEVKCIQFYGNDVVKPVPVYQIYRGDLFELIELSLSFVLSRINMKVGARDFGSQAPTEYELPVSAVSEAIVNAIAHRDYTSNGSIQIMLFRNRLEIWNPGALPQGLSIEKLYQPHKSIPVNPLIAHPLFLSGDIEKAGTGTSDIVNKCLSMGLKKPQFIQDENFRVIIWRGSANDQANDQVNDQANDQANDQQLENEEHIPISKKKKIRFNS
jgi:predicted HTH transcriptional regulator